VVDHGRVIARGTADQLKAQTGGERVEVVVHEREHIATASEVLRGFGKGETTVEEHTRKLTVPVTGGAKLLAEVIRELDSRGIEIDDIGLRRPTLDDVFLSLTGHVAEVKDEEGGAAGDARGRKPKVDPAKKDPAKKDPAKKDPAKKDPAKNETAQTEAAQTEATK
jgi:ABC-2 type transport system ATP-binding protein